MNNKTKKAIIGIILAGTIGGYIATGGAVKLDIAGESKWLTGNQYEQLRNEMVIKYQEDEGFTWQEFQLFAAVLDKEAKKEKFKNIPDITAGNLIPKMIEKIK